MKLAFRFGLKGLEVPVGQAVSGFVLPQCYVLFRVCLCHPELRVYNLNDSVYVISCVFLGCLKKSLVLIGKRK